MLIFQSSGLNLLMLSFLQPSVGEIDLMAIEFDQIRLDSVEKCAVPTMNRPHIHAIRKIPSEMEVAPLTLLKLFTLLSLLSVYIVHTNQAALHCLNRGMYALQSGVKNIKIAITISRSRFLTTPQP